jgi:hypothetical protein
MNTAGRAFHRWDLAFPQMGKTGGLAVGIGHVPSEPRMYANKRELQP